MGPELLSVIVPVYNCELYLRECIESLCNQTYKNLEIILINDGATDRSPDICDEYAKKDIRIQVIHQENKGLSAARNRGIEVSTAKYITFVDSDDFVLLEAFELSMDAVKKHNLDFVRFLAYRSGDGSSGTGDVTLSLEDEYEERIKKCIANSWAIAWGRVYRKELWDNIRFPEGRIFEDTFVAPYIIEKTKRCGTIEKELYFYRKNPCGICSTSIFNSKKRFDYVLACEEYLKFAIAKSVCIEEARGALIKSILYYLTAFYGADDKKDERFVYATELLRAELKLPYNRQRLNGKYQIYIKSFDKFEFVHYVSAKVSLYAQLIKSYIKSNK